MMNKTVLEIKESQSSQRCEAHMKRNIPHCSKQEKEKNIFKKQRNHSVERADKVWTPFWRRASGSLSRQRKEERRFLRKETERVKTETQKNKAFPESCHCHGVLPESEQELASSARNKGQVRWWRSKSPASANNFPIAFPYKMLWKYYSHQEA